jgi:hypothetical protein
VYPVLCVETYVGSWPNHSNLLMEELSCLISKSLDTELQEFSEIVITIMVILFPFGNFMKQLFLLL